MKYVEKNDFFLIHFFAKKIMCTKKKKEGIFDPYIAIPVISIG